MKVAVLYFAHARSARGQASESFDLPDGTTVAELKERLAVLLGSRVPTFLLARNEAYAAPEDALHDGDEVAVIPPVSGGAALIGPEAVDAAALVQAVQGPSQGAVCLFLGTVRNEFEGRPTARLQYEAYQPMAERELDSIAREAEAAYPGSRVALFHRIGTLELAEASVGIAASAPHRGDAFAACRQVIEEIKVRAPIWKREIAPDGAEHWHEEPQP
ncbi:MAG: molybdenum cofactor biosynthesis protein MoaE [Thermaerobacter sp.]|nr:molybdenum cofactor biosynthesis protein MoaE [Thermaerobacter sp.]